MSSLALCVTVAGALVARLDAPTFTLSWIHSVEKTAWEEDYRLRPGGLELVEARIRGTGAGMEPPEGAVLRGGVYHYRPTLPVLPELVLADAGVVPDRVLCVEGRCRPLHAWLPPVPPGEPVTLSVCSAGPGRPALPERR